MEAALTQLAPVPTDTVSVTGPCLFICANGTSMTGPRQGLAKKLLDSLPFPPWMEVDEEHLPRPALSVLSESQLHTQVITFTNYSPLPRESVF